MTELEQEKQLALGPQSCVITKTHVAPAPSPSSPVYLASLVLSSCYAVPAWTLVYIYSTIVWTPLMRENIPLIPP